MKSHKEFELKSQSQDYKGHSIELREGKAKFELYIDNIRMRYGQMHDGMYFLHEYAFDHTDNLMELAQRFINYRRTADKIRSERVSKEGGK